MRRLSYIFSLPSARKHTSSRFLQSIVNKSSMRFLIVLAALFALDLGFADPAHSDSYFYDPGGRLAGVFIQTTGGSAQY